MLEAKKGDLLDFSKPTNPEVPEAIEMIKLSAKQVAKGKEIVEKLKTKYKEGLKSQARSRSQSTMKSTERDKTSG